MKLPFAVYTARDGYAWQSGTEAGTVKLERLRKAIGKMPEFDFGDSASSGMLNVGDDIVLYRFMRQEKADSHGRAASYLAMTFFPRDDARFINADAILSLSPFSAPLKDPPSFFDYNGIPAIPSDFPLPAQSSTGCFDKSGVMASAGFLFSMPIEGTLHISRKEPQDSKGSLFQYQKPEPTRQQDLFRRPEPSERPCNVSALATIASPIWKWAAIAMGILALIEALALFYLVWEQMQNTTSQVQDTATTPVSAPPPSQSTTEMPAPSTIAETRTAEESTAQPSQLPENQETTPPTETPNEISLDGATPKSDYLREVPKLEMPFIEKGLKQDAVYE